MNLSNRYKSLFILFFLSILLYSCKSLPEKKSVPKKITISRKLLTQGQLSPQQLANFFIKNNSKINLEYITSFATYYVNEAKVENINSDIAFAQMCLETGFLRFGGLVQPDFHNYCGLGAMDAEHPGERFETEELGIRAHIQHLQAYATPKEISLNNPLIDPRYDWVHKTKLVDDIFGLTGTWATDPNYGTKIDEILSRMESFVNED